MGARPDRSVLFLGFAPLPRELSARSPPEIAEFSLEPGGSRLALEHPLEACFRTHVLRSSAAAKIVRKCFPKLAPRHALDKGPESLQFARYRASLRVFV